MSALMSRVLLIALGCAWCASALAQHRPTGLDGNTEAGGGCEQLRASRAEASKNGDMATLLESADAFVAGCRRVATRTEVSMAMAEGSIALRTTGQSSKALWRAQECIKFEYLGLVCHIHKALALEQMGMSEESKQVMMTAKDVMERMKVRGNHEIQRSAKARNRPDLQMMWKEGMDRVQMAQAWEPWLNRRLKPGL